jgi:hypothetical protein
VPGFVRLLAVVIPPQAASAAIEHPVDEKATRIACADPGSVVEVDVLLQRLPADADSWPGKGAMNTHLLGRLRFSDEYEIVVVWHYAQDPGLEHRAEVIRKSVARAVDRPDSTVLVTLADEIALPGGRDLRAILVSSGTHEGTEVHAFTEVAFNVSRNEEGVSGEE